MDEWAEVLGLSGWFTWKTDEGTHRVTAPGAPQGTTNPELLKTKHPAAVWFLLSALERFDKMTIEQIRALAFEIGVLGTKGLDYSSSEPKYQLTTCPGESFSGLQLMCLMYAGFQRFAPEQDVGMDLREPFLTALELYGHRSGERQA